MSLFFCCFVECVFNEIKLGRNIIFFLYFNKYFDGVKCVWVLQVLINYIVKLDLEEFYLEEDKKCFYDYMEFFDGDIEEYYLIRKRMCGGFYGF